MLPRRELRTAVRVASSKIGETGTAVHSFFLVNSLRGAVRTAFKKCWRAHKPLIRFGCLETRRLPR
jgi:hypothetical protein